MINIPPHKSWVNLVFWHLSHQEGSQETMRVSWHLWHTDSIWGAEVLCLGSNGRLSCCSFFFLVNYLNPRKLELFWYSEQCTLQSPKYIPRHQPHAKSLPKYEHPLDINKTWHEDGKSSYLLTAFLLRRLKGWLVFLRSFLGRLLWRLHIECIIDTCAWELHAHMHTLQPPRCCLEHCRGITAAGQRLSASL